jgi:hypothetical protein
VSFLAVELLTWRRLGSSKSPLKGLGQMMAKGGEVGDRQVSPRTRNGRSIDLIISSVSKRHSKEEGVSICEPIDQVSGTITRGTTVTTNTRSADSKERPRGWEPGVGRVYKDCPGHCAWEKRDSGGDYGRASWTRRNAVTRFVAVNDSVTLRCAACGLLQQAGVWLNATRTRSDPRVCLSTEKRLAF